MAWFEVFNVFSCHIVASSRTTSVCVCVSVLSHIYISVLNTEGQRYDRSHKVKIVRTTKFSCIFVLLVQ